MQPSDEHTLEELVYDFIIECLILFGIPGIPLYFGWFSRELRRALAAFMWLVFSAMVMAFSVSAAWFRNPNTMGTLPDLGHDMLGETLAEVHIPYPIDYSIPGHLLPEILVTFLVTITFLFILCCKQRLIIFKRVFCITGVLFLFRSCTVVLTTLPDSLPECASLTPGTVPWGDIKWDQVAYKALRIMLPMTSGVTCGDMIFSGHTVLVLMCAMCWHTYYSKTQTLCNPIKICIWVVTALAVIFITAVRFHYTIDILLGVYFSITVWGTYHRLADDVRVGYQFTTVWLIDGLIIYPLMYYMESCDERRNGCSPVLSPRGTLNHVYQMNHTNHIKDKAQ